MQANRENVTRAVYECIDELNEQLGEGQRLGRSCDAPLAGHEGGLDSLGFVTLVTLIEDKCHERFGKTLVLPEANERQHGRDPFGSVGALTEYIELAVNGRLDLWQ